MIFADIFAMILRIAELAFAAIVAGLTGQYLHQTQGASSWDQGRFIYAVVVAGLSIVLSLIWLLPFSGSFIHYPADFLISVMWWVVFGLYVQWLNGGCGYIFDWNNVAIRGEDQCGKWKANVAFAFLSALCWLVSALLGIYWVRRHRRNAAVAATAGTHRRRWYRSHRTSRI